MCVCVCNLEIHEYKNVQSKYIIIIIVLFTAFGVG